MLRGLLYIAVAVFAIWLVLNILGAVFSGLVHLLWLVILVVLAIWAFQYLAGRRSRPL